MSQAFRTFSFLKFTPPTGVGPTIIVARADIVAIEEAAFDNTRQRYRTLLHLRGGSTLLVNDDSDDVRRRIYEEGGSP